MSAIKWSTLSVCAIALVAHGGCVNDEPAPSGSDRALVVSDQVNNQGMQGFVFLPPMVPDPKVAFELEPRLQPVVRIDRLSESGQTIGSFATFSRTDGTDGARVRVDPKGHFFGVDWHTGGVVPGDLFRIRVTLGARQLGFADVAVVANKGIKNVQSTDSIPLVDGATLPIRFRIAKNAVPVLAPVTLRVLDVAEQPLAQAKVAIGALQLASDAQGRVHFDNVAPGRFVAEVTAAGYAPSTVVATATPGVDVTASVRVLATPPPATVPVSAGATVSQSGTSVTLPASGVTDSQGNPVTGSIDVAVTPLDPTTPALSAAPGPLVGVTAGGAEVPLAPLGMAEVRLTQDGAPLKIAPGRTARIELPLPAVAQDLAIGTAIPAWWYDATAGVWRQEGAGTVQLATGTTTQRAWVADVTHFSWWAFVWNLNDHIDCMSITVKDADGTPRAGVRVRAAITGYPDFTQWIGFETSNDQGVAPCVNYPYGLASVAVDDARWTQVGGPVYVQSSGGLSAACGGACHSVILVVAPSNDPGRCEDYNPCTGDSLVNGSCVYTAVSGSCGDPCLVNATCIDSVCAGAPQQTSCDDSNPCTSYDACTANGFCAGVAACDDANPCTADACSANGGCTHTPVAGPTCNDGNACTADDVCTIVAGQSHCGGLPMPVGAACTNTNPCAATAECMEVIVGQLRCLTTEYQPNCCCDSCRFTCADEGEGGRAWEAP
ncbi:MAG: hypothetical protein IT377_11935 [Polyangiaceae bacterium]|nr:hypothetical protein [Polyangiaceae bacterium]